MNMIKNFLIFSCLFLSNYSIVFANIDVICGGIDEIQPIHINPSTSSVNGLIIYVSFKDAPESEQNLPNYYQSVETNIHNFYEEMSYNSHQLNLNTALRPDSFITKCYITDDNTSEYSIPDNSDESMNKLGNLTNEIIGKVLADNSSILQDINVIFLCFSRDIFGNQYNHFSALATLGNNIIEYSGPGCVLSWHTQDELEWSIAHEYGHILGLSDMKNSYLKKFYGVYALMYNRHQTNKSGIGGPNPISAKNLRVLEWINDNRFIQVTSKIDVDIEDIRTVNGKVYQLKPKDSNQYFLIANHQRTGYEQIYEGKGLLIWHFNLSANYDIESAIGKWSDPDPVSGNWQNGLPDPIGGLDPLDFTDNYYNGSAGDFFNSLTLTAFTPFSNPGTNLYSGGLGSNENINSHVAIINIGPTVENAIRVSFIPNYWGGDLNPYPPDYTRTWKCNDSPYYIGADIEVKENETLIIEPGVEVIFLDRDDLNTGNNPNKSELVIKWSTHCQ